VASSHICASTGTSRPRPEVVVAVWHRPCRHIRIAAAARQRKEPAGWGRELDTFARAFGGAFLFGIPLLYTQETWNIGTYLDAGQLLLFLGLAFVVVFALSHMSGFRLAPDRHRFSVDLEETVQALAVGAVGGLVVMVSLARLGPDDPPEQWARLVALQTVPLSIGAALGNAFLAEGGSRVSGDDPPPAAAWKALGADVLATAFGAFFVCFNIAPTEEIQLLASEMSPLHLVALIGLSLVVGYAIVFEAEFLGIGRRRAQTGPFQQPVTETVLSYCVALMVAAGLLFLLGRVEPGDPIRDVVAQTIVLGLPATIGGAAGRLVA